MSNIPEVWKELDTSIVGQTIYNMVMDNCFAVAKVQSIHTDYAVTTLLEDKVKELSAEVGEVFVYAEGEHIFGERLWFFTVYRLKGREHVFKVYYGTEIQGHCILIDSLVEDLPSLEALFEHMEELIANLNYQTLAHDVGSLVCNERDIIVQVNAGFSLNLNSNKETLLFTGSTGLIVIKADTDPADILLSKDALAQLPCMSCDIQKLGNGQDDYSILVDGVVVGYLAIGSLLCTTDVVLSFLMYSQELPNRNCIKKMFTCEVRHHA